MSDPKTIVVKVNGKSPELWQAEPGNKYVGRLLVLRSGRYQGQMWGNSGFGNPYIFREKDDRTKRREKLLQYCYRLGNQLKTHGMIRDEFIGMAGKTIGCWCVDWSGGTIETPLCHACYLAQLVDLFHVTTSRRQVAVLIKLDGTIEFYSPDQAGVVIERSGKNFHVWISMASALGGIDFSGIA